MANGGKIDLPAIGLKLSIIVYLLLSDWRHKGYTLGVVDQLQIFQSHYLPNWAQFEHENISAYVKAESKYIEDIALIKHETEYEI